MGQTAIYSHTEGMGKILMNIFLLIIVGDTVKTDVLRVRDNGLYDFVKDILNNQAYVKLLGNKD
jgi:hypothetical protein